MTTNKLMLSDKKSSVLDKLTIQSRVVSVLEDLIGDWELDLEDGIGPETRLIEDLAFESIDVVQLVVGLEENFGHKGLPFEKLFMQDGQYVEEILVSEVIDFLDENLPEKSQ